MKLNRRKFLQSSASASASLLLSLNAIADATSLRAKEKLTDFNLKLLATHWGFKGTFDEYCVKVKEEGYDGIEVRWPPEKKDQDNIFANLKKNNLEAGFLCSGHQDNWQEHFDYFKKMIYAAATNPFYKPLYINCHSGRDFFSYDENKAFIDYTASLSKETGIKILHETHRSRMLFAAPVARQYIEKNPDLRITFDVSHWCNVSESLLQNQKETMELTLQRVDHIHARIGHEEGPQVNDPRAPEWADAVKAHFAWWDKIVERKKNLGETLTMLTEFGSPNYMPALPFTKQPLADQWEINVYMMNLLRKRYQ